jgi:cyanate permease
MQVAALLTLVLQSDPWIVFGASVVFGLGVGNLITFPSLIIQREFAPRDFARVVALLTAINQVTYAFGPGLLGWLRDLYGSYALPHLVAAALMGFAAVVVLIGPKRA